MQQFTLTIELGNEAMQTPRNVAAALKRVSAAINAGDWHPGHTKSIMDPNGNRVGSWKFDPA